MLSLILHSVDPHLGHVDYRSLSDQTLMELLIEGFDESSKKIYQDKDGVYLDVCEWHCVKCDDAGMVVEVVDCSRRKVSGPLALCYLPPKLRILTMDFKGLTGSVDLAHLPGSLTELELENNELTGSIDLTQLPPYMEILNLGSNRFEGSIDLTRLPERMESLFLDDNRLTGSFIATNLPHSLEEIDASRNQFGALAVVESKTNAKTMLLFIESGVTSVVDENGDKAVQRVFFHAQKFYE